MTKYLNIREYVSVYAPYDNNEDFLFYFRKLHSFINPS